MSWITADLSFNCSVLNAFKAIITDEDVLDKEDDSGVLDRMLEFLKSDEVSHLNAATTLVKNIERIVSFYPTIKVYILTKLTESGRPSQANPDQSRCTPTPHGTQNLQEIEASRY